MIAAEELARLRVPLASLRDFDPTGLDLQADGWTYPPHVLENGGDDLLVYDGKWRTSEPWWLRREGPDGVAWAIDLADASTADRVARWVAGRTGADSTSGLTWSFDYPGWSLRGARPMGPYAYFAPSVDGLMGAIAVPALANLDGFRSADDRRLPDGSRFVDRLALALVAVHIGGAT